MTRRFAPLLLAVLLLGAGCAGAPEPDSRHRVATPVLPPPPEPNGAIWQAGHGITLFADVRARQVGDLLTILLVERTQASKSSSTETSKGTSIDTGTPVLAGRPVTEDGIQILNNEVETEYDFAGEGSSSQSNRLDGRLTVTVTHVLPNGNLIVEGEKWLALNQGEEYVQVSGIVRPYDISTENTVLSSAVANARITYSGKGVLANANRQGWLSRFFQSPWMPF